MSHEKGFGLADEFRFTRGKVIGLAVLLAVIGLLVYIFRFSSFKDELTPEKIKGYMTDWGAGGYAAYAVSQGLNTVPFIQVNSFVLIASTVYGYWVCVALTFLGNVTGATLSYGVGRWLFGRAWIERLRQKPRLSAFQRRINDAVIWIEGAAAKSPKRVFALFTGIRVIPLIAGWIVSYGSGIVGVPFRKYLAATSAGLAIQSMLYVLVFSRIGDILISKGFTMDSLFIVDFLSQIIIGPLIIAILVFLWWKLTGRKRKDGTA
jgi:uncharacterized membrane protein YdjX (TVP38/TMEM64 family)